MMVDANIVAVSPTSVWRVLGQAGLLSKWNGRPSKNGKGFEQPLAAHQLQYSGRLQSLHCELGFARVNDRGGHRDHFRPRQGTSPAGEAPDHLRQRAAI